MTGKIIKVFGKYITISYGDREINSVLRGKIRKDKSLKRFSEPVATGDIVDFDINEDGSGVINYIHERKNVFTRKDRGRSKEDLIAANIDQIMVIQAFNTPVLNLRFVDRIIVRAVREGIPVSLCVNKSDLAIKEDIAFLQDYYKNTGLDVYITCAESGKGIRKVQKAITGKRTILVGYSGVGKTSILNRIYPGRNFRTSEVSEYSGKGRHTTTNVVMVTMDDNTEIIDTPGLREFGLMDIEPNSLGGYFSDFVEHSRFCNFRPCTHDHEPGCEVKRQVEEGNINYERYVSYLNILYSLKEYYNNMY